MSRSDKVAAGGSDAEFFAAAWAEEAPWEIGGPQPDITAAFDAGGLEGPVLDAGSGSGEHALLAAERGLTAVAIDFVPAAIELGRAKAAERGLDVHFEVADVLVHQPEEPYGTIVDVGLFHALSDEARRTYRAWAAGALRPGGTLLLLCFSDRQPGDGYPRRVTEAELRDLFGGDWMIDSLEPGRYHTVLPGGERWDGAHAWVARIRSPVSRLKQSNSE